METKRDIEAKAKSLLDSNPEEALKIYKNIYEIFPDEFNSWDAFYAIKASRLVQNADLKWPKELVEKYEDEKVANLYAWLVFDKCVKGKQRKELIQNEGIISTLPKYSPQKNLREDSSYPCPTTISILNLVDAYAENLFNAKKVNELLSVLERDLLSDQSRTLESEQKGDIELASNLEKFYALKTKALLKLGEYEDTIALCKEALQVFEKYHYNNDLWFNMRIAIAEEKLGNFEKSEMLFKELLSSRAGSDKWFLYRDISEIYFEQKEYEKAWKYAIDAAYYGNEPHFLIGLYLLQTRILYKLDRSEDGKVLAELIGAILNEQQWNNKPEYNRLFQYYTINKDTLPNIKEVLAEANKFWNKERYGNLDRIKGTIISVHKNGKIGRLKSAQGKICDFHKKDLRKKTRNLHQLKGLNAEYFEIEGENGKFHAEDILTKQPVKKEIINKFIGKPTEGTIKNITDFGIFVQLSGLSDGLLHKNNMPHKLRNSFKEDFKIGDRIRVVVEQETEKGIQLGYAS